MSRRQKAARAAYRLLEVRGRRAATAAAFLLLVVVLAAGCLIAWQVQQMKDQILKTQLVQSLTGGADLGRFSQLSDQGRLTQLLSDPQTAALLVSYFDSMADSLQNLDPSGRGAFARFCALLDAAEGSGAALTGFRWEENALMADCVSDREDASREMMEILGRDNLFSDAELSSLIGEKQGIFTICCKFSDLV
ncbi:MULTISPECIES: hypothetical protein [unclassified Anaerotruncus]|jgi:hypothetical protein|uniref:hypothetical protein n=1 Tax=unclassified Anaerotruncus TaxID=2641626 RepID=UPI000338BE9C|nr:MULTISPECIES: hypothetical protein [unclassified Anaerotruncus]MCI9161216.1 hypothetical protein [Anaerotruncus sp.]NCE74338.1 hypothetical protein [Anaerotruncus sp. X29]RKJ95965.1 hypothetical protein D7Y41_08730 [Anaerotruncus sp. 1XD22-93]EOS65560.1 hypothetical protein C814_00039 [Anaerotruncus sp. G3(2012)]NBK17357.1 hypothetical protein [Anaerotruncus sp. 1XD42-93]